MRARYGSGARAFRRVVHVDAECLDAWVLRAPRKSADNSCEICLERMTNVPTRAELRKERRSRREKHRARTASSSSSASARDDDARDDDARARDLEIGAERRFGDVSRRERCCLFACAPLACAYAVVHAFCAHRSCVFALILLAIGVCRAHARLDIALTPRSIAEGNDGRRFERGVPVDDARVSPRRRRRSVPRETRSTNVTRVTARSARASTRRNGRDDRASGARFVRERGALVLESTAK